MTPRTPSIGAFFRRCRPEADAPTTTSRTRWGCQQALPCVKRLEASGVIAGHSGLVDPARVGLGLTACLNVRQAKHSEINPRSPMETFAAAVPAGKSSSRPRRMKGTTAVPL